MYFSIYDMYFMLPAIIVTLWAQFKVKSTFSKYSSVKTINGKSGFEAARNILDQNGLQNMIPKPELSVYPTRFITDARFPLLELRPMRLVMQFSMQNNILRYISEALSYR